MGAWSLRFRLAENARTFLLALGQSSFHSNNFGGIKNH